MAIAEDIPGLFQGPARYVPHTPWGPVAAFLAFVGVVAAAIIIMVAALMVFILLTGTRPDFAETPADASAVLTSPLGLAITFGVYAIILIGVWLLAGRGGMRPQVLRYAGPAPSWLTCILAGLGVVAVSTVVELILAALGAKPSEDTAIFADALRSPLWPAVVAFGVLLAPLWEEIVFRGFLLSAFALNPLGIVGGGLLSNGLWTLLHWGYSVTGLLSVFFAGLVLTWLLWRTGSIRIAIVAHAVNNAAAFALTYFFAPTS